MFILYLSGSADLSQDPEAPVNQLVTDFGEILRGLTSKLVKKFFEILAHAWSEGAAVVTTQHQAKVANVKEKIHNLITEMNETVVK